MCCSVIIDSKLYNNYCYVLKCLRLKSTRDDCSLVTVPEKLIHVLGVSSVCDISITSSTPPKWNSININKRQFFHLKRNILLTIYEWTKKKRLYWMQKFYFYLINTPCVAYIPDINLIITSYEANNRKNNTKCNIISRAHVPRMHVMSNVCILLQRIIILF